MTDDTTVPPSSPFSARQVRILKLSILVMSILLVVGIMALIFGLSRQAARVAQSLPSQTSVLQAKVYSLNYKATGGKIVFASPNLVILQFTGNNNIETIIHYDPVSGQEYGSFTLSGKD